MGSHLIPLLVLAPIYHHRTPVQLNPHKDRVKSALEGKRQAQHLLSCLPDMESTYPMFIDALESSITTPHPGQMRP